jgi:hypothetical protein
VDTFLQDKLTSDGIGLAVFPPLFEHNDSDSVIDGFDGTPSRYTPNRQKYYKWSKKRLKSRLFALALRNWFAIKLGRTAI